MSKIKIGAKVTAKESPTKVTVSGTFQGYELEDQEDPTSICGKVFYVKDGKLYLAHVYVDSIKVCDSEDERIRKELLDAVDKARVFDIDKDVADRWTAWLEKQKEQKQEIKIVIPKFRVGDIVIKSTKEKWENPWKITHIREDGYNIESVDTYGGGFIGFSFEGEYELVEQPAEWSGEDESVVNLILKELEQDKKNQPDYSRHFTRLISWLKFLPKRFNFSSKQEWDENIIRKAIKEVGLTQHQIDWFKINVFPPKQEWSEEDEENLSDIKCALYDYYEEERVEELYNMIKSLRPQPHWKSSDE